MIDLTHLDALNVRLSHERVRLAAAKSAKETELRKVWVTGIEREIAAEMRFLDLSANETLPDMTDDELLAELSL